MKKTYIIAEIAQGYEGDINLVRRFIKLAKDCGADAVKFQIFKSEELCLPDYKWYELFESLDIPAEEWTKQIDYAAEIGIDFVADIFGPTTLKWMAKTKANGFKIHSTDIKNYELLSALRSGGYKIYLATGGSSLEEVEKAVNILSENDIVLMSGFQAEPNLHEDVELEKIAVLKEKFGLEIGYADHIEPGPLCISLPAMAVLKGASVIEKHLTIDREHLQLEDYISALNPDEFKEMVALVRGVEGFNHAPGYNLSEREEAYRQRSKKVVLAARDIATNEIIRAEDLTMLRTGQEVPEIIDLEEIIGKTAAGPLAKHAVIKRRDLK